MTLNIVLLSPILIESLSTYSFYDTAVVARKDRPNIYVHVGPVSHCISAVYILVYRPYISLYIANTGTSQNGVKLTASMKYVVIDDKSSRLCS